MKNGTSLYLDVVRFSAALAVFIEHFRERTANGFQSFWKLYPRLFHYVPSLAHVAVIIFFVLSGYVIAHVLATRERTLLDYSVSRLSRLYSVVIPALILTAATNYLEALRYPGIFDRALITNSDIPAGLFYLASLLFVSRFWVLPILEPPNIPIWSLSFEATYYVGIAVFVFVSGWWRIFGLFLLGMAAGPEIVLLAPTWILGYWAYHFSQRRQFGVLPSLVLWPACSMLLLLTPLIDVGVLRRIPFLGLPDPSLDHLLISGAAALCFTGSLLALAGLSEKAEIVLRPMSGPIRKLAATSFALYLFHAPLLSFFTVYSMPDRSSAAQAVWLIGGTFLVVATLGRFSEQSKDAYKRMFLSILLGMVGGATGARRIVAVTGRRKR
jgi:peptidoglycan/LPS O-acetylase OafA/YrhL